MANFLNAHSDDNPVKIIERVQAGKVFLFKFNCPRCDAEQFERYPFSTLSCCGVDISQMIIDIKHARLLTGSIAKRGRIGKRLIQRLVDIRGYQCAYCFKDLRGQQYHVEHILPLAVGGDNNLSNLCLSCPDCNFFAGSKVFGSVAFKALYVQRARGIKV